MVGSRWGLQRAIDRVGNYLDKVCAANVEIILCDIADDRRKLCWTHRTIMAQPHGPRYMSNFRGLCTSWKFGLMAMRIGPPFRK
jgi:hypothetical protein